MMLDSNIMNNCNTNNLASVDDNGYRVELVQDTVTRPNENVQKRETFGLNSKDHPLRQSNETEKTKQVN